MCRMKQRRSFLPENIYRIFYKIKGFSKPGYIFSLRYMHNIFLLLMNFVWFGLISIVFRQKFVFIFSIFVCVLFSHILKLLQLQKKNNFTQQKEFVLACSCAHTYVMWDCVNILFPKSTNLSLIVPAATIATPLSIVSVARTILLPLLLYH